MMRAIIPDSRTLTAIYLRNRIESSNANATIPGHPDRNKLALPGSFEKQFSRSEILDRLTVNRIRSQSGRLFELKPKGSRPIIGTISQGEQNVEGGGRQHVLNYSHSGYILQGYRRGAN